MKRHQTMGIQAFAAIIFTKRAMLEQYIKIWLRKLQNFFFYLRFLGVLAVAIVLFPASWSVVLVLVIAFLFYQFVSAEWDAFARSPFIQMMTQDDDVLLFVKTKVIGLLTLPIYLIVCIIYGLTSANWLVAWMVFICVEIHFDSSVAEVSMGTTLNV